MQIQKSSVLGGEIFRVVSGGFINALKWLCTEILPPLQKLAL